MNARVGLLSFREPDEDTFSSEKPYSQATARMIDEEVRKTVAAAYDSTVTLLTEKLPDLEKVRRGV
jgi:AFG3 family protein